jgi:hypothetical protein
VIVKDNEAPTLPCPAEIDIGNDQGQCGAIVIYTPIEADNCGHQSTIRDSGPAPGDFVSVASGTQTVQLTSNDINGNSGKHYSCCIDAIFVY